MPYEPGTAECLILIECKAQIEKMLIALAKADNTKHLCEDLIVLYKQLEKIHDLRRDEVT